MCGLSSVQDITAAQNPHPKRGGYRQKKKPSFPLNTGYCKSSRRLQKLRSHKTWLSVFAFGIIQNALVVYYF